MKNKAFTLVEMIAVVIILALLLLIAVPAIGAILANFRQVYYKNLEKELETASINYINTHRAKRPKDGDKKVICINELEKEKMIDKVLSYRHKKCDIKGDNDKKSYVLIEKKDNKYTYKFCLYCDDDSYSSKCNSSDLPNNVDPNELCK